MAVRNSNFSFARNSFQIITAGVFFITLALLPVSISYSEQHQAGIANAAPSTSLFFIPNTEPDKPLLTKPGDSIKLDVFMNPGTNLPFVTKLNIKYDPLVFEADNKSIIIDKKSFRKILEGPSVTDGNISLSLSTGSNPANVIRNITKIGTLILKVKSSTGGKVSELGFGKGTMILSVNESDLPGENVLEATLPAYIKVLTGLKSHDRPNKGILNLKVFLDGIGDNPEKRLNGKIVNNHAPRHPDRKVEVTIFNKSFEKIMELPGLISYDSNMGFFKGIAFITESIPDGKYYIKLRVAGYADKVTDSAQKISYGRENSIETFVMKTGDINFDNSINIADYNIMRNCLANSFENNYSRKIQDYYCDLNDDLEINDTDYELMQSGLPTTREQK